MLEAVEWRPCPFEISAPSRQQDPGAAAAAKRRNNIPKRHSIQSEVSSSNDLGRESLARPTLRLCDNSKGARVSEGNMLHFPRYSKEVIFKEGCSKQTAFRGAIEVDRSR